MNRMLAAAFVLVASVCSAIPVLAADASAGQATTQGCVNQWLSNGIWRFKVDSVDPLNDPDRPGSYGWDVKGEMRNATSSDDYYLSYTGYHALTLWFNDETALDISATTHGTLNSQKLTYHTFPQGSLFKDDLTFWYPSGTTQSDVQKPTKFVLSIDPKVQKTHTGPQYTVSDPSFTVKLDCSK